MNAEHAAVIIAPAPSIDEREIDRFSRLAAEWWNPDGPMRPLHRLNPTRLAFIREVALAHFRRDAKSLAPFGGLTLLDIGCGGGLLTEPMTQLGFNALGVDAAEKNIGIAQAHAAASGVGSRYRAATAETLAAERARFDVVLNMEVVEHVADVGGFLKACTDVLAPGGVTIVSTLNRTLKKSRACKGRRRICAALAAGRHPRMVALHHAVRVEDEAGRCRA